MTNTENNHKHNPMRRIFGNFGLLLRGRGIAAVMKFAATALMARALGPAEFGMVVLIQTYALLVRGLFNFQLFDSIVRYGVPLLDANDTSALRRLTAISWRLDKISSIVATIFAVSIAPLVGPWMGMAPDHIIVLSTYSIIILTTTGNGTAAGILRLYDQFDILGKQMAIGPIIFFCGVVFAWWFDASFIIYIVILALSAIAENVYLNWYGWRQYRDKIGSLANNQMLNNKGMAEFVGLKNFLWISYWQSNIDLIYKNMSIMMVGYFLGASEAGLLRLARQFSSLLGKPSALIRQVTFLDLTRSWNQSSSDFKLIAYRTTLLAGGVGVLFVLLSYFFGEFLLLTFVGEPYVAAAPVLTLLLLATAFDLAVSSLRAAAYAAGYAGKVLAINIVTTIIYIALFVQCINQLGVIGAGVAAAVAASIPLFALLFLLQRKTNLNTD